MLVDQIARPVVEVLDEGDIGQCIIWVLDAVQEMRIESLPPFSFASCAGFRVVGNARHRTGFVGTVAGLEPPPVAGFVQGDAEAPTLLARGRRPIADNIAMRSDSCRVPGLMLGVPSVETVMVIGQRNEESRAGLL